MKFEYNKGIKSNLAATLSWLIKIYPNIQSDPEPEGHTFGYYKFDTLIHCLMIVHFLKIKYLSTLLTMLF